MSNWYLENGYFFDFLNAFFFERQIWLPKNYIKRGRNAIIIAKIDYRVIFLVILFNQRLNKYEIFTECVPVYISVKDNKFVQKITVNVKQFIVIIWFWSIYNS